MLYNCKLSPKRDQRCPFVLDNRKLIKESLNGVSRQEDTTLHYRRKVATCLPIWPTPWAGKMNQILRCDWLPEWTIMLARDYGLSCEKILWRGGRFNKIFIRNLCREKYFPRQLKISCCLCISGIGKRENLKPQRKWKHKQTNKKKTFFRSQVPKI